MDDLLQQAEIYFRSGDLALAEALCNEILNHAPGKAEALRLMGALRVEDGRAAEAIPLLQQALHARPGDLDTLDALSAAYAAIGDYPRAEDLVRRSLAVDGDRPVVHLRLGLMLTSQGKWSEAAGAFEAAIAIEPRFADAHYQLGHTLEKLQRPQDAVDCFLRALAIEPANAEAHNALGFALQQLNLWRAAARRYERAIALDPGFANAHINLGLLRLSERDFERGWPDYEFRLRCPFIRTTLRKRVDSLDRYERLPRWPGPSESTAGEVAIWAEQGLGDQIVFSTLIPELIASGVRLRYEVDRRLLPAYERAFPGVRFEPHEDPPREAMQQADRVLLAGSLPRLFRGAQAAFARQPVRLLRALPEQVARYRRRLEALGPGLRIALSWSSTRQDWWVAKKSARLADFAPLLKLPGVRFVDVQYGNTAAERSAAEAATGVRLARFDDVDYFNDLESLLAILEACDLLITTSNVTAHLAGALGKRTWLLYLAGQPPFHYWAQGEDHRALWYPAVEIITGAEHADWPSLIQAAVEKLAAERGAGGLDNASLVPGGANELSPSPDRLSRARRMRVEGRLAEAVAASREILERTPGNAAAWSELAHALRWQNEMVEARAAATRAIELAPRLAGAWFNLGAIEVAEGDTVRGIGSYRKALELDPHFAEAWSNLGDALGLAGDRSAEIDAYRRAIAINPRLAPVWSNLGNAMLGSGHIGEALLAGRRATELDPGFAAGWSNLGNALRECGEHDEAVAACETALRLSPKLAEAWSTVGAALRALGRYEEAVQAHRTAIEIQPEMAHHHYNLGLTLQHCDRLPEAIESLRRALDLEPEDAVAHWDLSFTLLGSGQLPEGWKEYEWRWRRPQARAKRYEFTPWDGNPSKPRRLLLWAEQGVGDHILYGSLLDDLVTSPLRLTLEVSPRLVSIYQRSFPQITVIPQMEPPATDPSAYDCQAPLGSLGQWLRGSFESFPRHRGYLKADRSRVEAYRRRVRENAQPAQHVIGVSWKSANEEFGSRKSLSLLDWDRILRVPGVRFVDLQYGDTAGERAVVEPRTGTRIEHLPDLDLYDDIEGLAALCAACDLVITVSNVTAHVAGALGCPVWLLAPRGNGRLWYWFSGRSDSPWYPSMRIFSQPSPGDWHGVLAEVARDLPAFIGRVS